MKLHVNYNFEIKVDFLNIEKAESHFLSDEFSLWSGHTFDDLGETAGFFTQIILRDGLSRKSYEIEKIGTFHRYETDSSLHMSATDFGEIVITYDQPYWPF